MSRDRGPRESLELHGIGKRYLAGAGSCSIAVTALRRASIEIRCGEVVVVAGPIGSGKTTLLLCAAGLLSCDSGSVAGTPRVAYRDLHTPPRPIERMTRGSILLLDSCDGLSDLARVGLIKVTAEALAIGAGVVLAAREAAACLALVPTHATVSVVHLRLGETSAVDRLPITTRVAEPRRSLHASGANTEKSDQDLIHF